MDGGQNDAYQPSRSAQPVYSWRGRFNIPRQNVSINVAAHVSSHACLEVASIMPDSLCLEIVPRIDIWPLSFNNSPPTEQTVALFFFSEGRDEVVFSNLVTYAICRDFALKATIGKAELLVFTSLQLPENLHRFQGKPYLWGIFKGEHVGASHQSVHQLHIQTPIVRLSLSANSCGQRSLEGKESPVTISNEHSPSKVDRRGRRLDDGWQHANQLDPLKQKAECKYCGFVSSHGGISRLKAHLGGGHPKIRLPGCERVPLEVERVMGDWFNDWVYKTKALWTKEIRAEIGAHDEMDSPHDTTIWEDPKRDFNGSFSFDFSRGEISPKVPVGENKNANGEAWPKVSSGTRGVISVKLKNVEASISPETKGVKPGSSKSSSSKIKHAQDSEQSDKRGRPLDNAWQHAKALDEARQKTQCNYCGFISMYGGISRLKAHLGGGSNEMQLQGCPRVSLEIKSLMEEWFTEWVKHASATWARRSHEKTPSAKSHKRRKPLDDTWEHAEPLDESRQATRCKYCGLVSKRGGIARMRAHLGGGDLAMQLEGCPCVPPEVKSSMMPTPHKKKYKKKSKVVQSEAAGEVQETSEYEKEPHWFQ